MPLSDRSRQAILAAYGRIVAGREVTTGDTDFWRQFGLPPWRQRNLILERAQALQQGTQQAIGGGFSGSLADVWQGTGYERCGARCGPAETEKATVRGRAAFIDSRGRLTYRSFSRQFDWDDSLESVDAAFASWIRNMQRGYGLEEGVMVEESIMIY